MTTNMIRLVSNVPNVAKPAGLDEPITVNTEETAVLEVYRKLAMREFNWSVEYQIEDNGPWFTDPNFRSDNKRIYKISPNRPTEALQVRTKCVCVDYSGWKFTYTRLLLGDFITPVP